jgi:hypothetical protein
MPKETPQFRGRSGEKVKKKGPTFRGRIGTRSMTGAAGQAEGTVQRRKRDTARALAAARRAVGGGSQSTDSNQ